MRKHLTLAYFLLILTLATESPPSSEVDTDTPILPVYLAIGYNLLKGNPLDNHVDEGFTHPIFKITYHNKQTTTDGKYIVPDNMVHRVVSSCSFSSAVSEHRGTQSYQKSIMSNIKVQAGMSGIIWQTAFSASVNYQNVENQTIKQKMSLTHASAECEVYHLQVDYYKDSILQHDFQKAVNNSYVHNDWQTFIQVYGTHFIKDVTMGGRAVQQISYTFQSMSKMKTLNIDVEVAAKARYASFFGDTSVDVHKFQQEINYSSKLSSSTSEIYIGGHPPKNGNIRTWTDQVINNPMPIRYSALEMTNLFDKVSIFYVKQNLDKVKNSFVFGLNSYCKKVNCKIPLKDLPQPPAAIIQRSNTSYVGGGGGGGFTWYIANPIANVKKFLVNAANTLDTLQLMISDGVTMIYSPKVGHNASKYSQWTVPDDQYVTQIELTSDTYVRGFTVITNKGVKSPRFGSTGGNYRLITFPSGYRVIGFYGRSGSIVDQLGFILGNTIYPSSTPGQFEQGEIIKTEDGKDLHLLRVELA